MNMNSLEKKLRITTAIKRNKEMMKIVQMTMVKIEMGIMITNRLGVLYS